MQIIFGEKCVLLLRLSFTAVLMLWCAQTAAHSGQCHTTQGSLYISVNFGVKTLEEEENTVGVVKDKFYQWNESNDYYVSCDCDKDNVRSGRWASTVDSPLVYLGDNQYKINDYLAAKVLLRVKGGFPIAVLFENMGTGADTRWHICDPGGQRLGGQGASGNSDSSSLKILQPSVGSVVIPPMALARLFECYNIPAGDSCTTTGTPVLVYYLSGTISSLGSYSVNAEETIEVDLGDVFAANFRVAGHKPFGARTVELAVPIRCNTGSAGLVNVNLSLTVTTDPSYPQTIKTSCPGVGVVVTDSQNNIISPAGGTLPLSTPDNADSIARMSVYSVSTTSVSSETGRFEAMATVRINFD